MMNYCTLFDSHYIDKGIVLYRSLKKSANDFCLYIFCFDDKTYDVLGDMNLSNVQLIREAEIEYPELLRAKGNRTRSEYCWTCASVIIKFVLDNFNVENCTYIDSDLFFYKDPKCLIEELEKDEHILITPHRLLDYGKDKKTKERYGIYCVEFNYFDQSKESREALDWWINSCLEWCYCKVEDGKYGDQKYLDHFKRKFSGVHELNNLGGGVAPWNLKQYHFVDIKNDIPVLEEIATKKQFELVFYHFQSIRFLSDSIINIMSGTRDVFTKRQIYYPYLREILQIRDELGRYGIKFSNTITHGNGIKAFYQKAIRPLLIKNYSDIVNTNRL